MTTYATTLNSGYGQGTYVASASSDQFTGSAAYAAWTAFAKGASGALGWVTVSGTYNTSAPYGPTGSTTTVDVNGTSYAGEWLQLQMPSSIVLSNYQINTGGSAGTQRPSKWFVLGSRDGTNWFLVDSQTNPTLITSTFVTFPVSSGQAFTYIRWVINQVSGAAFVNGGSVVFNGTIEGPNVTADGRLGVGVSNPVQALEVAGSAVVAGTLSAGNPLMFRNRIINGDMMIAQRGTSTALATQTLTYSTDRFFSYYTFSGGGLTTYQNTLSVTDAPYQQGLLYATNVVCTSTLSGTAGGASLSGQVVEGFSARDFGWGTSSGVPVTLSFWFKSNLSGYTSASVRNKSAYNWSWTSPQLTYSTAGVWQYYTVTVPPPQGGSTWGSGNASFAEVIINGLQAGVSSTGWNNSTSMGYSGQIFPSTSGNYVAFTGVQLEKGLVATPFEVRPYATELALCQRYFIRLAGLTDPYHPFGMGMATTSTTAWIFIRLPVNMRTSPTFASNASSSYILTIGGPSFPVVTAFALYANDSSGVEAVRLDATIASGMTSGGAVLLRANNTLYGYLDFIAEI
jgi:hypothetical protein